MPNFGSPSHDRDDPALLEASRTGDTAAFAELWSRHSAAGRVAARSLAPHLDADDLVSEAYLKIFALVRDGRGPTGAFRPYLYRVIKTTAADTDRGSFEQDAEPETVPTPDSEIPGADEGFDHDTVARAFTTLNERWQAVLWYTEVEGLPPREIASILGISPNGVSALAVRARKALRTAWIDAHVEQDVVSEECASTRKLLQRYGQHRLTAGKRRAVEAHLDDCASCRSASEELRVLDLDLARTLAIALLGFGGTGALLAALGHGTAVAGGGTAAVALGSAAGSGGTGAGAAAGGATAATSTGFLAGVAAPVAIVTTVGVAAAAAITGAVLFPPSATGNRPTTSSSNTTDRTPGRTTKPGTTTPRPAEKRPTAKPAPTPDPTAAAEAVAGVQGTGGSDGQRPTPTPTPEPTTPPTPGPKPTPTPTPTPTPNPKPSAGYTGCSLTPSAPSGAIAQAAGAASMPGTVFLTVRIPGRSPQSMSVGTFGPSNAWISPSLLGGTTTQLPAGVTLADVQVRIGFSSAAGSAQPLDITLADCD